MKKIIFFCSSIISSATYGQDTSPGVIKNEFLIIDYSNGKFFNVQEAVSTSFFIEMKNKVTFGARYCHRFFQDPNYVHDYDGIGSRITNIFGGRVYHQLTEFDFYLGRNFKPDESGNILFSIATGPSYTMYTRPENIVEKTGGFFTTYVYQYDTKNYELPGWSGRLVFLFLSSRYFGVQLGGYYSWNRMQPMGGLSAGITIGYFSDYKK